MVSPFKIGTLVTGIDRSYERSIYRLEEDKSDGTGLYKIIAYRGQTDFATQRQIYPREHSDFRVAEWIEIKKASTCSHHELLQLLYDLGIGHQVRFNRYF